VSFLLVFIFVIIDLMFNLLIEVYRYNVIITSKS